VPVKRKVPLTASARIKVGQTAVDAHPARTAVARTKHSAVAGAGKQVCAASDQRIDALALEAVVMLPLGGNN
jgi:hypothetical protein